jgi:hypothetical protein
LAQTINGLPLEFFLYKPIFYTRRTHRGYAFLKKRRFSRDKRRCGERLAAPFTGMNGMIFGDIWG